MLTSAATRSMACEHSLRMRIRLCHPGGDERFDLRFGGMLQTRDRNLA
jgi:hypothetical protein